MAPPNHPDETVFRSSDDRLRGRLLRPDDEGYDDARTVWSALIDREHDFPLSVEAGGHNVSGSAVCDDGVVTSSEFQLHPVGPEMNFLTDDDRPGAAYGDDYDRLAEIKAEWDPGNLFRSNQNVEPAP